MCSLLEPAILLGFSSLVVAPFVATFVFGAAPGLSLHFAAVMLGTWAGGLVVLPLVIAALVLAISGTLMSADRLFKAIFPASRK